MQQRTPRNRFRIGYLIAVFFLCYVFAYYDRQILTVLVQPVKTSLHFSDTQIGMLQGFAFALFYSVGGLPVAWLIDRGNRVRIVTGCLLVWSVATAASGFATSFGQLLLARAGTAAAESALVPAGLSIFADAMSPRSVPRAIAAMMLAPFIGAGAALMIGSAGLAHFSAADVHPFGLSLLPWQWVYVSAGAPGLLLVILLLLLREPERREIFGDPRASSAIPPTPREVLRFLFCDSRFFGAYIGGMCIILMMFYAQLAWFLPLLSREFVTPVPVVGKWLGPTFMLAGIAGTIASQLFLRRLRDEDVVQRVVSLVAKASACALLLALAIPFIPSLKAGIALYAATTFTTSIITSIMNVPLQLGVPNRMRGLTVGIAVFGASLLGTGLGPLLTGLMNDRVFGGAGSLARSLGVVSIVAAGAATILLATAKKVAEHSHTLEDAAGAENPQVGPSSGRST